MAIKEFLEKSRGYGEWADKAIKQNRTGSFKIDFSSEGDLPQIKVKYKLKRHDFDFGCNIFMMNQYVFYGTYEIEVCADGKAQKFDVILNKDASSNTILRI